MGPIGGSQMRGGKREGAGRREAGTKYVMIRLSPEQHEALKQLGGSAWIQNQLTEIMEKKMTTKIDTTKFKEEDRAAFIEGWEMAGGVTDDANSDNPCPWCCPWDYSETIEVTGTDVKDWGRQYWLQCKPEVEAALAEEAAAKAAEDEE